MFTVYKNLSPGAVARLQENLFDFNGIDLIEHSERNFTEHCGGNFVGYINEISASQLEQEQFASYQKGDYIGITGIERQYEEVLRGSLGCNICFVM